MPRFRRVVFDTGQNRLSSQLRDAGGAGTLDRSSRATQFITPTRSRPHPASRPPRREGRSGEVCSLQSATGLQTSACVTMGRVDHHCGISVVPGRLDGVGKLSHHHYNQKTVVTLRAILRAVRRRSVPPGFPRQPPRLPTGSTRRRWHWDTRWQRPGYRHRGFSADNAPPTCRCRW